ncbi:MAG: glycosyl hydrolase [Ilumatobacteraceae bacterium]|nr:glycosyl hydrolase [Ilumatobacteraceae bacterium]
MYTAHSNNSVTPRRKRSWALSLLVATLAIAAAGIVVGEANQVAGAPDTSAYRPVTPFRAGDTRIDLGFTRVDDHTMRLQIAGRNGVPADATAAAVTIVATNGTAPGHALTYRAGSTRPNASNINYEVGETYSTGAIVELSDGGAIDVYTLTPVDIVIDVTGAFVPVTESRGGRFIGVDPLRALDTRETRAFSAGETRDVEIPVAWTNATGALVTLTVTPPNVPGYFTAYAEGRRPETSTVNVPTAGATRATTAIVPISKKNMKLYSSHGGNVIVDVIGFFTSPYGEMSSEGLYVPTTPTRRIDTRESGAVNAGTARAFDVQGGVTVGSLAMVDSFGPGFASLYANGTEQPITSSINATSESFIANMVVSRASRSGVSVFSSNTSHYVYDQFGYFIADEAAIVAPTAPTKPVPSPPGVTPTPPAPAPSPSGCHVSELLVPSCGVWLGATTPSRDGSFDYDRGLAEYENVAQNTPDILHFYKTGAQKFPTSWEIAQTERPGKQRSLLLYNWKPSKSDTWAQIANGAADSEIATVANSLKKYPDKLFLNIFHEPEDNVQDWSGSGMTAADYGNMYRYVVNKLRAHGVTNAVYVWNPMGYYGWRHYFDDLYPGHDYVDWMCYDPYATDNRFNGFGELINDDRPDLNWPGFYNWSLAKAPGKPLMMCEWGVDVDGNADPASVLKVDPNTIMAKYPHLKAIVYFNDNGRWDTRLTNTTTKGKALGDAYRNFANQPIFNQMTP